MRSKHHARDEHCLSLDRDGAGEVPIRYFLSVRVAVPPQARSYNPTPASAAMLGISYDRISTEALADQSCSLGMIVMKRGINPPLRLDLFDGFQLPIRIVGEMVDHRSISNGKFIWRTDKFPEKGRDEICTKV